MIIGGFQKLSLIDYPGKLSSVIYTRGCNFRCFYCHNPQLVLPELYGEPYSEEKIFEFLQKRRNQIDGVVITGGEPTIHQDLIALILKIKELGYSIKLDTNGTNPDMIETLLFMDLLDYIAMDVKAPLHKYDKIIGYKIDVLRIRRSINIILNSGIEHEFRTTVVTSDLTSEDIVSIGELIRHASNYTLQQFNHTNILDKSHQPQSDILSNEEYCSIRENLNQYIHNFAIR